MHEIFYEWLDSVHNPVYTGWVVSSADINDAIKRLNEGAGDFGVIKEKMRSYCNWTIISKWNDKNLRWNILRSEGVKEIEEIAEQTIGFTHEFVFYKIKSN